MTMHSEWMNKSVIGVIAAMTCRQKKSQAYISRYSGIGTNKTVTTQSSQPFSNHSNEQKKHIATTLRIIGIGGFVTYAWPEITIKALSKLPTSLTAPVPHGFYIIIGLGVFGLAEVFAILTLKGVN